MAIPPVAPVVTVATVTAPKVVDINDILATRAPGAIFEKALNNKDMYEFLSRSQKIHFV